MCGMSIVQYGLSTGDWANFPSAVPDPTLTRSHPPPLFIHSNLLKHSHGVSQSEIFSVVKHAKEDRVDRNSDDIRAAVYKLKDGTLCVDIQHAGDEGANTVIEDASVAYVGVLKRFREAYFSYGGMDVTGW